MRGDWYFITDIFSIHGDDCFLVDRRLIELALGFFLNLRLDRRHDLLGRIGELSILLRTAFRPFHSFRIVQRHGIISIT
ncbi:hypothetical protein Acid345_3906 [Candidatus Koribacter versatilis Ellin345]|uniref:Uncharacterized protein n=1 Tax=Koribacter versatilis (strain Ellin345) TaxID=204669 RepID=Q1IJP4_KORVE|nr:hypothetical protein Acid345_3906 [Candidatus Koribacter versatilis Ellin345]